MTQYGINKLAKMHSLQALMILDWI